MTHVKLVARGHEGGTLEIDGVDLSRAVLKDGVSVDFTFDPPRVTMVVAADVLEMDLPEAVIQATREDGAA